MHPDNRPAVTLSNLTKRFGSVTALDDVTFDVPAGSIFGFLGPNGAGKTTAIKILAGLTHATSGTATIGGVPVSAEGTHRRALGYLAQDPLFYDWMTGRETLRYVASFYPDVAHPGSRVEDLLRLAGINDAADRTVKTYSGGMRQRLGVAQALVGRPSVILLDEPAASLDPLGRRDVLELLQQLRSEATILYSTHILDDVQRVSDHVAILDRGRVVRAAPTSELLASFSQNLLTVVLGGASAGTAVELAQLPGVATVKPIGPVIGESAFEVATRPGEGLSFAGTLDTRLLAQCVTRWPECVAPARPETVRGTRTLWLLIRRMTLQASSAPSAATVAPRSHEPPARVSRAPARMTGRDPR